MNARENELANQLKRIRKFDKEIRALDLERQYLDDGLFTQSRLTQTKVTSSKTTDIADRYNKQIERKEEIAQRIESLLEERTRLIGLIEQLDEPDYRMVLKLEYVNGMNIYDILDFLEISKATFYVWKRKALKELCKVVK